MLLFLFLFLFFFFIDKGKAEEEAGVKEVFEVLKEGPSKYGSANLEYLKQLDYNLNLASDSSYVSKPLPQRRDLINNNYKYGYFYPLAQVPNSICACAITLFSSYKDEVQCYDDCVRYNKTKCGCDLYDHTLPLKVLCYKHNCLGRSIDETAQEYVFAPLIYTFVIFGIISLLLLLFSPFVFINIPFQGF
jgi:hypothetical protein